MPKVKGTRMKNYVAAALLLLSTSLAQGMENSATLSIPTDESINSPFFIPELRLPLMETLFTITSNEEAVKAFVRCALVNKESLKFFKDSAQYTTIFSRSLYSLSYYNDLNNKTILKQLEHLLNKEGLDTFNKELDLGWKLRRIFEECVAKKKWDRALEELSLKENCSLLKSAVNYYYWKDCRHPIKITLLADVLEKDAPDEVILILISHGAYVNKLHRSTPQPFLILFTKFLAYHSNPKLYSETAQPLIKEDLDRKMDLLIKKGASLSNSSYEAGTVLDRKMTPLYAAVKSGDPQMVYYLIEKGLYREDSGTFERIVNLFVVDKISLDMLKAVISIPGSTICFLQRLLVVIPQFNEDKQAKALVILSLLLEQKIDLNDASEELSFLLAVAEIVGNNDKVIDLLIQRGFTHAIYDTNRETLLDLHKKLLKVTTLEEVDQIFNELTVVLKDIGLGELWSIAIQIPLRLACGNFSNVPAARDFLKYIASVEKYLSFNLDDYQVTSVFHALVAWLAFEQSKPENLQYEILLAGMPELILWLAQEGVKDERVSEGKTAAEKARELDMPEIADCIASPLTWKGLPERRELKVCTIQ